MNAEKTIHYLQKILGLTQNEAKTYAALLEHPKADVSSLSKITRLPRSRIYEMLAKLSSKGLLEKKIGSATYKIIPPREAFQKIAENLEKECKKKIQAIHEFSNFMQETWNKQLRQEISLGVEIITFEDIEPIFLEDLRNTQKLVLIAASSETPSINWRKSGEILLRTHHTQKTVRYLTSSRELANRILSALTRFTNNKQQVPIDVRYNTQLYTSFVILDKILFLFFFGNDPTEVQVMRTSSEHLYKSMTWMYNTLWESAEKINTKPL